MPSRVILLTIGGLVFLAGLAVTLTPFTGSFGPADNRRTVSCRAPVLAAGLEDTRIRLAALERLDSGDRASDDPPSREELLRLAELERAGEEYRACKKRGATRMRIGGLLEAAGVVVVVFLLLERVARSGPSRAHPSVTERAS